MLAAERGAEREAVNIGQHDIEEDQINGVLLEEPAHLTRVAERRRLIAAVLQKKDEHLAHERIVLDDQDVRFHCFATHPCHPVRGALSRAIIAIPPPSCDSSESFSRRMTPATNDQRRHSERSVFDDVYVSH